MNKQSDKNLIQMPFPDVREVQNFVRHGLGNRQIKHIIILRQRDFSVVGRLFLQDGTTAIYKKVQTPWDCEADIVSAIDEIQNPNIPKIYGVSKGNGCAEILQEDVGERSLRDKNSWLLAERAATVLSNIHARLSRASGTFPRFDSSEAISHSFADATKKLEELDTSFDRTALARMRSIGAKVAEILADSSMCLQHGDVYAENIILRREEEPVFIDWSYFSFFGPRVYDLATLVSAHPKNGALIRHRQNLILSYAKASGTSSLDLERQLPAAYRFSRLLFLKWLLVRFDMGIKQTTVGCVKKLMHKVVAEIID